MIEKELVPKIEPLEDDDSFNTILYITFALPLLPLLEHNPIPTLYNIQKPTIWALNDLVRCPNYKNLDRTH